MRILVAARHAPGGHRPIGGVQSWGATVMGELCRLGHEVTTWEPGSGARLTGTFDIGILANAADTNPVRVFCRQNLTICHGIIAPEKPPLRDVAFTSEEVREHWRGDGPIVRQPIDLDFWRPLATQKRYLVRFSYRTGLAIARWAARTLRLPFTHISAAGPEQARATLNHAVCVLASGRAALEAMACGVPVVLCDERHYQGPLLDPDILGAMTRNYSGRGGMVPTKDNILDAIDAAIGRGSLRPHVESHHDARRVVSDLLCSFC